MNIVTHSCESIGIENELEGQCSYLFSFNNCFEVNTDRYSQCKNMLFKKCRNDTAQIINF